MRTHAPLPSTPRSFRKRAAQRGVAMVEGALVMLILMAPIYGLMRFQHQTYVKRLEADSSTRMHVAGSASRSCRDDGGNATIEQGEGGITSGAGNAAANGAAGEAGESAKGAAEVTGKWVSNATERKESSVSGRVADASRMGKMSSLSGKVSSQLKMACNERPYDGNMKGWFNFAKGSFSGSGATGTLGSQGSSQ